jgi:hypothetical protein
MDQSKGLVHMYYVSYDILAVVLIHFLIIHITYNNVANATQSCKSVDLAGALAYAELGGS